ncbi:BlaI/MecI/CopY family transcriptional regulator [Amylibacter sp.]|jgi:predicted transcriptional regulator|nr:BlaI/MecI/CopY family transcriptional regulator [Amylibacter sp.]
MESETPMARRKNELLTEVELEFMKVLWSGRVGTVRQIYAELAKETTRAYTSVATTLKVLEGKGYVSSVKDDRTLSYKPTLSKNSYEQKSIREMSKSLFDGTPSALVARLVEDEELSDDMIAEIQNIIDQRLGRDDS